MRVAPSLFPPQPTVRTLGAREKSPALTATYGAFPGSRFASKMRDHLIREQLHAGAHLLRIDSRQRHPERKMRRVLVDLLNLRNRLVGRPNHHTVAEEPCVGRLAQFAHRWNLRETLVAPNVGGFRDPLAVTGQQVMQPEFALVPRLVPASPDKTEAQLRDVESGGIASGGAQRFAINLGLMRARPCQMGTVARPAFGRRARAGADPYGRMRLLDRFGIERHVAHREMLTLEREIVLGERAPHDLDA